MLEINNLGTGGININAGGGTSEIIAGADGSLVFSSFGTGTFTDTDDAFMLTVDANGNVQETAIPSFTDTALGTDDQTLTSAWTVDMNGQSLTFDGSKDVTITPTGSIGVGIANPDAGIHLLQATNAHIIVETTDPTSGWSMLSARGVDTGIATQYINKGASGNWVTGLYGYGGANDYRISTGTNLSAGVPRLTVKPDGKVAMGGDTVETALRVNGLTQDDAAPRIIMSDVDGDFYYADASIFSDTTLADRNLVAASLVSRRLRPR